jgi:hypothetical protein
MADEPLLAGDLAVFGIAEVIAFLSTAEKTGILECRLPGDVLKRLYFEQGQIVFATSTLTDDRLGESLVRAGRITRAQLDIAARAITPGNKLGKILVEMGRLTPRDLFGAVRRQVEEIVESLFDFDEGRFAFTGGLPEGATRVRLSAPTRDVVMAALDRKGAAESPAETAATESADLAALVARYDRALSIITAAMRERGLDPEAQLADFLNGGRPALFVGVGQGRDRLFQGVRLGAPEGLDIKRLIANATGPGGAAALGETPAAYVEAGLEDLFAFSLFALQDLVAPDEAEQLAARIRAIFAAPGAEAGGDG